MIQVGGDRHPCLPRRPARVARSPRRRAVLAGTGRDATHRRAGLLAPLFFAAALLAQTGTLLEQADAAFREGNFEQAAALARRVLARDAGAVHAHMILGVVAAQKNDWEVSNKHFQAVVRLDPANPYGYFYLGQAALYQQQWERLLLSLLGFVLARLAVTRLTRPFGKPSNLQTREASHAPEPR